MKTKQALAGVLVGWVMVLSLWATSCIAEIGVVIDKATRKPKPGVHVVATWVGSMNALIASRTICYHAEATSTDDQGQFEVSAYSGNWNPLLMDRVRSLWVLAPGYRVSAETGPGSLRVIVEPQPGTNHGQFDRLPTAYPLSCPIPKKDLLPYLRVLYGEAKRLAENNEQKKVASGYLFEIESIEVGKDEAFRRLAERERGLTGGAQ